MRLAVLAGLIEAYKNSDHGMLIQYLQSILLAEEIDELSQELEEEASMSQDNAKLQAALIYLHYQELYEARKYADMADDNYRDKFINSSVVKGWIKLSSGTDIAMTDSDKCFESALKASGARLDTEVMYYALFITL